MRISSRNNPIITEASKLLDKKYRDKSGLFLLHGKKLTDEAILTGTRVRRIFAVPELEEYARGASSASGAELIVVEPHVFEKLTDQRAPEGVCAEAVMRDDAKEPEDGSFVVICDRIADPGNLGTVLRSARAFSAGTVILSRGCADLYSPKVQRGAMGAGLSGSIIKDADTLNTVSALRLRGFRVYAAALHTDAVPLCRADLSGSCAVVIGNEGQGLADDVIRACTGALLIEMEPQCESLNAAVAASVIMYKRYTGG